jgi:hypothetical protein
MRNYENAGINRLPVFDEIANPGRGLTSFTGATV